MVAGPSRAAVVAAALTLALALATAALGQSERSAAGGHGGPLGISAAGAFRLEDSRGERAILTAPALAPGATVDGKVTIVNRGRAGRLVLSRRHLTEAPGAGGSSLAQALLLKIRDLSTAGQPIVYSGPLGAMPSLHLGRLPTGASRRYRFLARLPEPGFVDLGLMGAQARFDYFWRLLPPHP